MRELNGEDLGFGKLLRNVDLHGVDYWEKLGTRAARVALD